MRIVHGPADTAAATSPARRALARGVALALALVLATGVTVVGVAPPAHAASTYVAPLPARTYVLSSYYGPRCMPIAGASAWHLGQDMGAASGTDVKAIAAGTVTRAGAVSGFGQWVVIEHTISGKKVSSVYGHVIDGDRYVKVGSKVSQGQHVADVGSSGTSTSPHLHLEIWKGSYGNGATVVDALAALKYYGVDLTTTSTRNYSRTVPSSCTYYTTANVNLRTGPGTSYSSLRVVPVNGRMTAKPGASSGSWRKVTYGSTTGWMSASYVSPNLTVLGTRWVRVSALHLRSKPSTSSTIVRTLSRGQAVGLLSATTSTGWVRVKVGSSTGYVAATYLSRVPQ
ncbi:SH3 domain-containing protein [Sediminihabitans luteus]|uniref:SH3 domain-containing protein n=1 Tax=Sediminihabitans luteus TaxID=1138585 RepID=A0A2M9D0M2_9CELL|nr:M23 family metallopeptidase [Sediminihabitans luteus]PJJ77746.1 SH3 domain-containing protein [Sediminihabitans luteus]GIJ00027.1 hypothetical protein Slu03_24040 [Sediminihabitans luteus]